MYYPIPIFSVLHDEKHVVQRWANFVWALAMLFQTGFNIYELVFLSRARNLKTITRVSYGSFAVAILSGLACYSAIINRCMYTYIAGGLVGILASMRLASAVLILTYPNRSLLEGLRDWIQCV